MSRAQNGTVTSKKVHVIHFFDYVNVLGFTVIRNFVHIHVKNRGMYFENAWIRLMKKKGLNFENLCVEK